jgi:hypothetical protein
MGEPSRNQGTRPRLPGSTRHRALIPGHVRAATRGAGKPVRPAAQARALTAGERNWAQRYAAGEGSVSIARSAGIEPASVRGWLRRRGVPVRDSSGAARMRAVREGRDPAPRRRRLSLRDGTRGRTVLALLGGHPDGLTAPQCATLAGEQPVQRVVARFGAVLRDAGAAGWVRRAGKTPGRWGQAPAVIWVITGPGRAALAVPARPRRQPAPARAQLAGPAAPGDVANPAAITGTGPGPLAIRIPAPSRPGIQDGGQEARTPALGPGPVPVTCAMRPQEGDSR